ncbi:hypothetical protein GALL_446320 [mine drainage metagenome]|uniref:Uncharacterized protein n=1 Tax=mine drainage metagenome TaxID=410659 RepID=A0A1J5PRF5_9ZZZZ
MVNMTCTRIETACPNGAMLVYCNTRGEERIDISFLLNGSIRHQPLNWSLRLARHTYYATLVRFYRELRRNGITQRSLHHLAGGAKRGRHGGWAIGTAGHRDFQAWLSKARSAIALSFRHLTEPCAAECAPPREHAHID